MFFFKKKQPVPLDQKKQEIFNRIKPILSKITEIEENKITPDANFEQDLGVDSLDTIEIVMALEEEFDIEISDEDAENIKTVGSLIDYLINLKEKKGL